ncbi:MAG: hypothetical protein P8X57_13525, partial [Cyclobacteriaceae bacterium]
PSIDFSAFNQLKKAHQIRILGDFPRKLDSFNELECANYMSFIYYNSGFTISGFNRLYSVHDLRFNGKNGLEHESIEITGFKNLENVGVWCE